MTSKLPSKQMSQPCPPQRWKKPVTVITVTQAPTSSFKLLLQMPSDRQMFPIRNTALSELLVASPTRTALPQPSLAGAVTCWSHLSSAGLSSDHGAQTDHVALLERERALLFLVINVFLSRKLSGAGDIRQFTPCLLFSQQHLCSGFLELKNPLDHSWEFEIASGTMCLLCSGLIIKINYVS